MICGQDFVIYTVFFTRNANLRSKNIQCWARRENQEKLT